MWVSSQGVWATPPPSGRGRGGRGPAGCRPAPGPWPAPAPGPAPGPPAQPRPLCPQGGRPTLGPARAARPLCPQADAPPRPLAPPRPRPARAAPPPLPAGRTSHPRPRPRSPAPLPAGGRPALGPAPAPPRPRSPAPSARRADAQPPASASTNVVLRHDGAVRWDAPAITRSSCRVDVSAFPFDAQRCGLTFGSWTHGGHQLDVRPRGAAAGLADFVENVEWRVLGMPARRRVLTYGCCSEPYPDVTFTLLLRRRAAAYVCNLLLPCVLISLLAPLAFHLPADSGEKVSLGVTVLLALTVFQLLLAESMPPAESVPLIGKYYMATMTMVTFSTALTILIMNLHYCGPSARPVPAWARTLLLGRLARGLCVRERGEPCGQARPPESSPSPRPPDGGARPPAVPCREPRCLCRQEALLHHVATIANAFHSHRAAQRRHEDWKRLARVMDRFFLGIFFSMALVMSLLVLVQAL
uniref:Nucleoporin 98 and 96 n=1 Tax=Canis lupus familiaris TaxID=9615 RepID=A0A8C0TEU9_CANLF